MVLIDTSLIKRIVVRGPNWVGDAVIGVPALRELRRVFPTAEITLVARPGAEGLFADADFVDSILPYDRVGTLSFVRQVRSWRTRSFDLAVLFQNAFEAALIAFLARVPLRVGYATDGRAPLLTHRLPLPEWRDKKHQVFYYLNIVREVAERLDPRVADANEPGFSLSVPPSHRKKALEIVSAGGAVEGRRLVALCPGSINSRAKRWPAERYAQLADRLIDELNTNVLLIGSKEEVDVSAEVVQKMRRSPIILTGKTSLAEVVGVLSLVDLLITNDTGPAHIAAALDRPTLVIFGPTNPLTTRPYSQSAEIVHRPPDCAPCMLRDCPIDHRCMTAITVDEVFGRAQSLLGREGAVANHQVHEAAHNFNGKGVPTLSR